MSEFVERDVATWCNSFGLLAAPVKLPPESELEWSIKVQSSPDDLFVLVSQASSAPSHLGIYSMLQAVEDHLTILRNAGLRAHQLFVTDLRLQLNMLPVEHNIVGDNSNIGVGIGVQLHDNYINRQSFYNALQAVRSALSITDLMFCKLVLKGDWR